jgi:hypothetical protein
MPGDQDFLRGAETRASSRAISDRFMSHAKIPEIAPHGAPF